MSEYIIIKTYSDKVGVLEKISNVLLEKRFVCSCHTSKIYSVYNYNGKRYEKSEYVLDMRSKKFLFNEVSEIIKLFHNYDVPEISYVLMDCDNNTKKWIDEEIIREEVI